MRISSNSYTLKLEVLFLPYTMSPLEHFSVTHKVFVISPSFFSYLYPQEQSRLFWRTLVSLDGGHFVYSLWVFKS